MGRYSEEIEFLRKVENLNDGTNCTREKFSHEQIAKLYDKYPSIPQDYLDYLKEIGSGTFRRCQFIVYDSLGTFNDYCGDAYDFKENVLFFGDNFAGDMSGFHLEHDWAIVEFLHESGELKYTNLTFYDYIREQMLIDESKC